MCYTATETSPLDRYRPHACLIFDEIKTHPHPHTHAPQMIRTPVSCALKLSVFRPSGGMPPTLDVAATAAICPSLPRCRDLWAGWWWWGGGVVLWGYNCISALARAYPGQYQRISSCLPGPHVCHWTQHNDHVCRPHAGPDYPSCQLNSASRLSVFPDHPSHP